MTDVGYYPAEDPFEVRIPKKKVLRPKPKRCKKCKNHIESDGYGEWVHSGTEEWPGAYYACHSFVKKDDPRYLHMATV
jgi:hypothetical protein